MMIVPVYYEQKARRIPKMNANMNRGCIGDSKYYTSLEVSLCQRIRKTYTGKLTIEFAIIKSN